MNYLWAAAIFTAGELLGLVIFHFLKKALGPPATSKAAKGAVLKGVLERLTLFTGLLHGFPQIIIAFGALKLGTRLHEEQGSEISNSYFLAGNLISILLAMAYAIATKSLWEAG
ncbi:hypothetical protein AAU61_14945 [Desulfocarbo indianensis]|nr:hypothetical protein AAU61_14945 [Desulfocarbo indianensis]